MKKKKPLTSDEQSKLDDIVESVFIGPFFEDVESKFLTWQITDYEIVKGFPKQLGLKLYNESLPGLISEGKKAGFPWKNEEEQERVLAEFKKYIRTFRAMIDQAIDGKKPTEGDKKILEDALLKKEFLKFAKDTKTGRFSPGIWVSLPRSNHALWRWLYYIWRGQIRVKRCKATDCNEVFIPKRSDQEYCSARCYDRLYKRRMRALSRKKEEPGS